MSRIADIKQRREDRFWENRMKLARVEKKDNIEKEVINGVHLVSRNEKTEEMLERVRENVVARQEEKQEKRRQMSKGKMVVEEEL